MARRPTPQPDDAPVRVRALIGPQLIWIGFLVSGFGIASSAIRQHPVLWSEIVRYSGGLAEWRLRGVGMILDVVPTARRAMALAALGMRFTRTWRGPSDPTGLLREVRQRAGREPLATMPATGLYELAACLLLADRVPDQRDAALARVRVIVSQLADQSLPHDLYPAGSALASSMFSEVVRYAGGTRRDAERLAIMELGQPHGPLVEYLGPRLARLARSLESEGDPATAAAVRRLAYRWLASWVRELGPPALRVLAADVLADVLEADPAFDADPEWIHGLRELRREYRDHVEHKAPPPEQIPGSPPWRQRAARTLIARLARTVWLASAAVLAGTIAALLTLLALARGVPRPSKGAVRRFTTAAAVGALLLGAAGWGAAASGWIHLPDALPDRAATVRAMVPAAAGGAAGVLVFCGVAALLVRPPRSAKLVLLTVWLAITSAVLFQASGLTLGHPPAATSWQTFEPESLFGHLPGRRSGQIVASLPERLPPR